MSAVCKSIISEIRGLFDNPPDDIRIKIVNDIITDMIAFIKGPGMSDYFSVSSLLLTRYLKEGTPFENGVFKIKLVFGDDFPLSPPKGFFITKIFHPNVSPKGEICVNTLKKDWNPNLGIRHTLLAIKCLLIYPNPESALNEEAGKLLLEDYENYKSYASLMTSIHATRLKWSDLVSSNDKSNSVNKDLQENDVSMINKSKAAVPKKKFSSIAQKSSIGRL